MIAPWNTQLPLGLQPSNGIILMWTYLSYCRLIWQTDCICQLQLSATNTAYLVRFRGPQKTNDCMWKIFYGKPHSLANWPTGIWKNLPRKTVVRSNQCNIRPMSILKRVIIIMRRVINEMKHVCTASITTSRPMSENKAYGPIFSARQHICYSALFANARPSVCPPVCLSHGWISQRRLKLGSRNFHHRVAPWL